jgi:hypothetical protein
MYENRERKKNTANILQYPNKNTIDQPETHKARACKNKWGSDFRF